MNAQIERIFRAEYGRAVAILTRFLGDLSLAEEAVQDAFTIATQRWPQTGVPPAPAGWIITTARNRAIDRLRREASRDQRQAAALELMEQDPGDHDVNDDRLRLIFTCCHPAIAPEAQLALTLRLLGGLTTAQIARAFLVPEPTLAQRVTRAKSKIRAAGIPFRVPEAAELPARLHTVLGVIYLIFNEGYSASGGDELMCVELCEEAIRLGRLLLELMPREPEVLGLLALMLMIDARRAARVDAGGNLVPLTQQDRSAWDRVRIEEGQTLLRHCLARNQPGPYQIQAAINAVHSDARSAGATDWAQILALYDELMRLAPSPVVALNRAVAVGELAGAETALPLVEALALPGYHPYHAVRAHLLRACGRDADAAAAFQEALRHCDNTRERAFLAAQYHAIASN